MKSYSQFMSESVNISGDFNGNLYINSQPEEPQQVGETYSADVLYNGELYNIEFVSEDTPTKHGLVEMLQGEYPGAMVQAIYPVEKSRLNITKSNKVTIDGEGHKYGAF
ncbi:hypothetical protein [Synechococcus phage S-H35]|uniref:Uncharacterized protein n=2 Tax=Shandvirus TaxID=2948904 RepID=A0A1Z1LWL7_9CAUD|nr:hypothetical protein KNT63_gp191 [Synechococcus phage S-H35]ARW57071.1 hypothetical protein [Synechococcus phage S-H35]